MADNANSGSSSDDQNKAALPNMDYGPPVLGHDNTPTPQHAGTSSTGQDSQNQLPNMDYGPPVLGHDNTPTPGHSPTDSAPIDITDTGTPATDEPFVGSGGVGSPEYMDSLRRAHEQAGGEYTSDLQSHDDSKGGTGSA